MKLNRKNSHYVLHYQLKDFLCTLKFRLPFNRRDFTLSPFLGRNGCRFLRGSCRFAITRIKLKLRISF
jgi:hypothetical protein